MPRPANGPQIDLAEWRAGSDHAWRYFELHATQRMTVFNFFTGLTGLLLGGIAASMQLTPGFAWIGVFLGGLLTILAFVFWQLDRRVSGMIKLAENALAEAETQTLPAPCRIFTQDSSLSIQSPVQLLQIRRPWTYGRSFRLLFTVMAALGILTAGFSAIRIMGKPYASPTQPVQAARPAAPDSATGQLAGSTVDDQPDRTPPLPARAPTPSTSTQK